MSAEDEQAIRTVIQTWMDATRRHDDAAVLELMTDDVVFLTAQAPPFGKAEFAKSLAAMKGMTFDGKSDIQEIQVNGDWAWVRSELVVNVKKPDGTDMVRRGPVLSIFRRGDDGQWRVARDANLVR